MSDTQIDERIVSMEFDNKEFEKNVQQSLTTLQKLKLALRFDKSYADAFKGIENYSKKVSFDGLNDSINTVKSHFSAMEVVGVTALMNITNHAIDTGRRLVKALSIDQVMNGFNKYAEKTSSVQTIINATGKSMEDVTETLEKLNWFTDETSYNFLDMVNNIGKFTSNNIELEKAETAMEGIATWAAVSGANAQAASRAMYNISQSVSQGSMKLMDWMSIENANMATAQFKETAIETAAALGTLKKDANGMFTTLKGNVVTVENFRTTLSDAWFTSEVIMESLSKYGGFAGKLYEAIDKIDDSMTASRMLMYIDQYKDGVLDLEEVAKETGSTIQDLTVVFDELSSDTYELGRKSFKAAQEAKTFGEALDATKDAVSTGWMNIFEQIFGTYDEAKKLWTGLANLLYDAFAGPLNDWVNILKEWKGEGRPKLLDAFANSLMAILNILQPIKDAWNAVFGKDEEKRVNDLVSLTGKFADFTARLSISSKTAEDLRIIFTGLFSILKSILSVVASLLKLISPALTIVRVLVSLVTTLLASVTNLVTPFAKLVNPARILVRIFTAMKVILFILAGSIAFLVMKIRDLIYYIRSIPVFSTIFDKASKSVRNLISWFKNLLSLKISDIFNGLVKIVNKLNELKNSILNSRYVQAFINHISNGVEFIRVRFANLVNIVKTLIQEITGVGKATSDVFKNNDAETFFEMILDKIKKIKDFGKIVFNNVRNFVASIIGKDGKISVQTLRENIEEFIKKLREFTSVVSPARLSAIAMSLAFIGLAGSISKASNALSEALKGITGFFGTLNSALKKIGTKSTWVRDFGFTIAMIAGSLAVLAMIEDQTKLRQAAITLGVFISVMVGVLELIEVISNKFREEKGMQSDIKAIATVILSLSSSVVILVASLKILQNVDTTGLFKKVLAIGLIMVELAAVTAAYGKFSPKFNAGVLTMLIISTSVANLVNSLAKLNSVDFDLSNKNILALLTVMVALGLLARGVGSIGIGSLAGLFIIIKSLDQLVPVIKRLSELDLSKYSRPLSKFLSTLGDYIYAIFNMVRDFMRLSDTSGLMAIIGTIAVIDTIINVMDKAFKNMSITILSIAASMMIILFVFKEFDKLKMSQKTFEQAMKYILDLIVVLGSFTALISLVSKLNGDQKMASTAGTIIAIGVVLAEMALLANIFSKVEDVEAMDRGIRTLWSMVISLGALLLSASRLKSGGLAPLITIIVGMAVLFGMASVFAGFDYDELSKAIIGVAGLSGALTLLILAVNYLTDKLDEKKILALAGSIAIMTSSFIAIAYSLKILSGENWDSLSTGILGIFSLFVLIGGSIFLLSNYVDDYKRLAVTSASISGMLIAATLSLFGVAMVADKIVSKMQNFNKSLKFIIVTLGTMAFVIAGLEILNDKIYNNDIKRFAVVIGGIFAGLLSVVLSIWAVAEVANRVVSKIKNLDAVLTFIISIMGTMAGVLVILELVGVLINKLSAEIGGDVLIAAVSASLLSLGTAILEFGLSLLAASYGLKIGVETLQNLFTFIKEGLTIDDASLIAKVLTELSSGLVSIGQAGMVLALGSIGILAAGAGFIVLGNGLKTLFDSYREATKIEGRRNRLGSPLETIAEGLKALSNSGVALIIGVPGLTLAGVAMHYLADPLLKLSKVKYTVISNGLKSLDDVALSLAIGMTALGLAAPLLQQFSIILPEFSTNIRKLGVSMKITNRELDNFVDISKKVEKRAKEVGKYFAKGMSKGTNDSAAKKEINTAGINLANVLINAVISKRGLDEHSPSKKAIEIARFFGVGITEGMESDADVYRAIAVKCFGTNITEGIQNFWETEGVQNLTNGAKELFEKFGYDITGDSAVGEVVDKVKSIFGADDAFSDLSENMKNSISLFDEFNKTTEITSAQMIKNFDSQLSGMLQWKDNLLILFNRGISPELYEYLVGMGQKEGYAYVQALMTASDEEIQRLNNQFKSYSTGLIENAAGELKNAAVEAGVNAGLQFDTKLGDSVNKNSNKLFNAGKNTANWTLSGFISGFNKKQPDALKIVNTFSKKIINAVNKPLLINSPSRVFEEIGGYVVEGFNIGIRKNMDSSFDTTELLGLNAVDAMKYALNNLDHDISSNLSLEPVIRPVLDTSDLENGANNIASIFNGRYSTGLYANQANRYFRNVEEGKITERNTSNNSDVVSELTNLRNDISILGESMRNLKVVMNSDAVVGEIAPSMDTALGIRATRNRREK